MPPRLADPVRWHGHRRQQGGIGDRRRLAPVAGRRVDIDHGVNPLLIIQRRARAAPRGCAVQFRLSVARAPSPERERGGNAVLRPQPSWTHRDERPGARRRSVTRWHGPHVRRLGQRHRYCANGWRSHLPRLGDDGEVRNHSAQSGREKSAPERVHLVRTPVFPSLLPDRVAKEVRAAASDRGHLC